MQKTILILGLLFSNLIYCQYKTVDNKMKNLPEEYTKSTELMANYISQNFASEDEKIRAIYYWITSTMSYDVDYDFSQKAPKDEEKTEYILSKKIGVCMHYAQLFNDLANKVGIKTYLIDGYTKRKDGKIAWINHLWNVSRIDGTWYMFDSTWGAGYVEDNHFFENLNDTYFKCTYKTFLKDHMPFDYMWQLNNKPITHDDFYNSKVESNGISDNYDFSKEIEAFEKMSEAEKLEKEIERIKQLDFKNDHIIKRYRILKTKVDIIVVNQIVSEFKESVAHFNEFAKDAKNQKISNTNKDEIKDKILISYNKLLHCENELDKIRSIGQENETNFANLKRQIGEFKGRLESQLKFIEMINKRNATMSKKVSAKA